MFSAHFVSHENRGGVGVKFWHGRFVQVAAARRLVDVRDRGKESHTQDYENGCMVEFWRQPTAY
jgi:hypothetical protein